MSKTALVIGGGWAGLSAAVELSDKGYRVTVLEGAGRLGGRASSFVEAKTGQTLDNGQHLMMGCYTHTLNFLKKTGAMDKVRFQPSLRVDFVNVRGEEHVLQCGSWPAPFHLISGILGLGTLTLGEKISMVKVERAVRNWTREQTDALTAEQWLVQLGQSRNARDAFWDPIILATLNELPSVADATSLAIVLKEAFFADREKSQAVIGTAGLSDLCGPGAAAYVAAHGGAVRANALAAKIVFENGRVKHVVMREGETLSADLYVSAVPFFVLENLLGDRASDPFFSPIRNLDSAPIFSVTLWFDRPVTDKEFVGLLGTQVHWVFNKAKILGGKANYLSLVISGAHALLEKTNEEILRMCLEEMRACFPKSREAKLVHSLIVREKNATLSPKVGYWKHRLAQKTPVSNLLLCGDWTDTGFPATIESAVYSGVLAASHA